jgi:hypothetical protein
MYKKLVAFACALGCLAATNSVRAQSVLFYDNSIDSGFYYPAGVEIAVPITFSGSYLVDTIVYQYVLPEDNTFGPTTDVIIRVYEPGPSGGAFGDGILISAVNEDTLPSSDGTGSVEVTEDLTFFGNQFRWDAKTIVTGEVGGWISFEFSNPEAGLVTATGGTNDDFFQDMTDGTFYDFGGDPQASFYIQLYGAQIVPEPGLLALFAGLLVSGGLVSLLRRRRLPSANSTMD